jgi:hypothetical protein
MILKELIKTHNLKTGDIVECIIPPTSSTIAIGFGRNSDSIPSYTVGMYQLNNSIAGELTIYCKESGYVFVNECADGKFKIADKKKDNTDTLLKIVKISNRMNKMLSELMSMQCEVKELESEIKLGEYND